MDLLYVVLTKCGQKIKIFKNQKKFQKQKF
jgi:hypothetical protein